MQDQDPHILFEKYLAGNCTEQEKAWLESWYLEYKEQNLPNLTSAQFQEIENSHPKVLGASPRVVSFWPRIAAAAAVLLLVLGGAWLVVRKSNLATVAEQHISRDIKPGNNKAILTLANGQKIILNNAKIGQMATQGNAAVAKIAEGQLAYNASTTMALAEVLNKIETPRGGQYQVVLADGTKVWLNAASSLIFPTAFTGKQRRVELHGEGYFEVAKNKNMPFIVSSDEQQVEVLGTHFNISAYKDDNGVFKTTLLEGSVRLNNKVMMVPGDEADNTNNNIKLKQVDAENSIAWKNGKFTFQNEDIQSLMRKIARWYDVQVVYSGSMMHKNFSGSVSRFANIATMLGVLESTNTIHFKIEGRRITVMP
ncbi:FecR family protein [Mucilaginibacter gracilis]|uniref:FecR family protein n=1 Tax=Mucilaginibacter gracilis TaxID=423350 RepID=A0A495J4V6_9SPHI|nr:FecR family protein [Mucilaginibacter gracilis]RKR84010.1 FecR family protein [Mucilaginibacter gracilis]